MVEDEGRDSLSQRGIADVGLGQTASRGKIRTPGG